MLNSVEVEYYDSFKKTLIDILSDKVKTLEEFIELQDVLKCASDRFISIAKYNQWSSTEIKDYTLVYVVRAVCGLDRLIKEEDSWVGFHSMAGIRNPTIIEAPVLFLHDVIHWREANKLVTAYMTMDFLADYPYMLSGRLTVGEYESTDVRELMIMRGLLTDRFKQTTSLTGMYLEQDVPNMIAELPRFRNK